MCCVSMTPATYVEYTLAVVTASPIHPPMQRWLQGLRPYVLHTTYSTPPGAAWEGQAVRDEQVYAPQGSAVGPY